MIPWLRFGFVYMESAEAAAQAISEVNGSFWQGRRIQCSMKTSRKPVSRAVQEPTKFVYIGNIPYETTDAELNRLFKSLDNVEDVRVAVDRVTGWPRGFAHADFIDVESAQRAYQKLNGLQLGGRALRVDYTLGPQENSNKKNRKPASEESEDLD
jgi:RNA recognition motif-containing protein